MKKFIIKNGIKIKDVAFNWRKKRTNKIMTDKKFILADLKLTVEKI